VDTFKNHKYNMWTKIGAIILIVSFVGGIGLAAVSLKNPSKVAVAEGSFPTNRSSCSFNLDEGDYEIWCMDTEDPGPVIIKDPAGQIIFDVPANRTSGLTINDEDYSKLGSLTAETSGTYTASALGSGHIYITPPIKSGVFIGAILGAIFGCIIGIIFLNKGKRIAAERGEAVRMSGSDQYPSYGFDRR
jgi:hypothetical protein